ncbi:MAG TPA: hypothetical protein VGF60_06965 [Xanthobacteraceae bacterium]|jgi:hypothetical protein
MPEFLFNLTFGDRVWPDEEGVRLPDRAAARAEAEAIVRELSPRGVERSRTRWAGWFLRVEDAGDEFLALPLGRPALAAVPRAVASAVQRRTGALEVRRTELARQTMETLERLAYLMDLNRRVRGEVAVGRLLSDEMRHRAEQLRVSALAVRSAMAAAAQFRAMAGKGEPKRGTPTLKMELWQELQLAMKVKFPGTLR